MRSSAKNVVKIMIRALLALFATSASTALAWDTTRIFPLENGAKWKYTGTWENINTGEKIPISLDAKVLRFVNGGGYIGAHMQGHPTDIENFKSGTIKSSTYVYYILGNNVYMITDQANMGTAMSGRYDPKPEEIFMTLPLKTGTYFDKMAGDTGWTVEAAKIPIPSFKCTMDGHMLILKKEDRGKLMTFVPLVGITSYQYVNYKTGDKLQLNLSEYITGN